MLQKSQHMHFADKMQDQVSFEDSPQLVPPCWEIPGGVPTTCSCPWLMLPSYWCSIGTSVQMVPTVKIYRYCSTLSFRKVLHCENHFISWVLKLLVTGSIVSYIEAHSSSNVCAVPQQCDSIACDDDSSVLLLYDARCPTMTALHFLGKKKGR